MKMLIVVDTLLLPLNQPLMTLKVKGHLVSLTLIMCMSNVPSLKRLSLMVLKLFKNSVTGMNE